MSEVQQYIGVSKNCKCNCLSQDKNAYSQKPHDGEHEIMQYRQIRKKLKKLKLPTLYKTIEEFTKTFGQQVRKLTKKIQMHQKSAEKAIKTKLISQIMDSELSGDDQTLQLLQKIKQEEYIELKCGQISKVLGSLKDKEFQNREQLKFIIGDIYKDFKDQLIKQLDQLCSYYVFESQLKKQQLQHASLPVLVEESIVDAFHVNGPINGNSLENCNNLQLMMAKQKIGLNDERQQINSVWHSKSHQKISENQTKEVSNYQQQYKPDQSIIQILAEMDKGEQIEIENNNESTIQIINQTQINNLIEPIQKQPAHKQIPLIKLQDLNKPLYNKDFATFNIRVKVIKVIFCYIPEEDEGLKIKFVGADETGFIICQTNCLHVQANTEMIMENASIIIINKQTKFWEISSNKCKICKDSKIKEINKEKCLSKFQSMKTFSFSLQSYSKKWLKWITIHDIKQVKNANTKIKSKLSLIVRINQKTENLNGLLRCYVSDGTQKIWICIKKGDSCIQVGKVYLLQNILNGSNHQDVICQNATLLTNEITEEFGKQ